MGVRGWVYVISNKAMPDLIKVGYSLKDPDLRANELDNTGAPHPYVVEYEVLVYNPLEIEQRAHKELNDFREAKEWFRCSLGEAIDAIQKIIGDGDILLENIIGDIGSVKGEDKIITRDNRFIAFDNGTVLDTHMNRMWAAKDNGSDINWLDAKYYCENYQGGGYKDWRMPALEELGGLDSHFRYYESDSDVDDDPTDLICLTGTWVWSSNLNNSTACTYNFSNGHDGWDYLETLFFIRALPVRSAK